MRTPVRLLIMLVVGVLSLSACSGGDDENKNNEGGGTESCEGAALGADELKLPADFPIPGEAILTDASAAGPSQVVEGYYEADLESAYNEWKEALEDAGYSILFDEIEENDSEISYKSADETSTGQIALRSECEEAGRTLVHITNRPA
jgi:hypothetical protein